MYFRMIQTVVLIAFLFTVFVYTLDVTSHQNLQGHLGKLGEQREPSVTTAELDYVPQPESFYQDYVAKNRPVVFRGAAKRSRAFDLWTEEYLKTNYGNLTIRLEARAEDDNRIPVGKIGLGQDLVGNFIDKYQTLNGYIISQLPMPMEQDIMIPPCLRCGFFARSVQEVHLFLSASGGKTALHKDPYNNIHCVFNGTKDWITIHPQQTEQIYMSEDSKYEWGGLSDINVDAVDLDQYPDVAKVNFSKVRLHKGDCIFVPSGYWHQVRSWGYFNSAVSIWFSTMTSFDQSECSKDNYDFKPMNEVDILWRYSGYGNMTQGHMDIYILQRTLVKWANNDGIVWLRPFVESFFALMEYNADNEAMVRDMESRREKFVQYLDEDGRGYTTTDIINNLNTSQLKDLVEIIHPNDISNTDVFEYGHIIADDISDEILQALRPNGTFDKNAFITSYVEGLGGTEGKARQILKDLRLPLNGITTKAHLAGNMNNVLWRYMNAIRHDPASEKRIFQFLETGKRNFQHDEL